MQCCTLQKTQRQPFRNGLKCDNSKKCFGPIDMGRKVSGITTSDFLDSVVRCIENGIFYYTE